MEVNPLFTVIIPTFNRADLLERAIQSVCNQTFQNWELLVMDDGSTDTTEACVLAIPDSRICYYKLEHGERSNARNQGILHASGKYICFLDDDDVYLPDYLQDFYDYYEKKDFPEAILRTGFIRMKGGKEIKMPLYDKRKHDNPVRFAAFHMCGVWSLSIPKLFLKDDIFPVAFPHWQDTHLILRLFSKYEVVQLPFYQYQYHIHEQMGSRKMGEKLEEKLALNLTPIHHIFDNYGALLQPFLPDNTQNFLIAKKYLEFSQVALENRQFSLGRKYLQKSLNLHISHRFWKHYIFLCWQFIRKIF